MKRSLTVLRKRALEHSRTRRSKTRRVIEYRFDERFETDAITIMKKDGDWVLHGLHPFCAAKPHQSKGVNRL